MALSRRGNGPSWLGAAASGAAGSTRASISSMGSCEPVGRWLTTVSMSDGVTSDSTVGGYFERGFFGAGCASWQSSAIDGGVDGSQDSPRMTTELNTSSFRRGGISERFAV